MEARQMRRGCASSNANGLCLAAGGGRVHWLLAALVLALVLIASSGLIALVEAQEQITVESRDVSSKQSPSGENELSDTLKYLEKLEKLDQYWSEVARPRFGRSGYKQPLLGFRQQPSQQQRQQQLLARPQAPLSLAELINARLARKYNSDEAY